MFPFPSSLSISIVSFETTVQSPIFLLIVSPLPPFQYPSSFPLLFLLISFLLSSLTWLLVCIFPVRSQLLHTSITPNVTVPIFLLTVSLLLLFEFFCGLVSYFPNSVLLISITNYEILNFLYRSCFSASSFPVFILRFLYLQIFTLSFIAQPSLRNADFPKFTANLKVFPFNVPITSLFFCFIFLRS